MMERIMASNVESALQPVLEARGINKHFGPVQALKSVNLSVFPGEVVALIGDNGAGKSTTMRILACILAPTQGTAEVAGHNILRESFDVRRHLAHEARQHGVRAAAPGGDVLDAHAVTTSPSTEIRNMKK